MSGMARLLMTVGGIIFLAGAAWWVADALGISLGRLPGDISYEGKNFRVYAPIGTMIVISAAISLILNIIYRSRK